MSETGPPLSEQDEYLIKYKKGIGFDGSKMVDNRRIGDDYLKEFIKDVKKESKLEHIKYIPQGSAFENVNVFNPNHIDYLIVLSAAHENKPNDKIKQDLKAFFKPKYLQEDMLAYDTIQMPGFISKNKDYEKRFFEEWPGTRQKCLSSHKMNTWWKDQLYKYWNKMRFQPNIEGVVGITQPQTHNAALKTDLDKADGTTLSIYMTVCIRLYDPDEDLYFIPKRSHDMADRYLKERAPLLWMQTNSAEEKDAIWSKFEHQRENYRILKGLLYKKDFIANDGTESYIIKAIFLRDIVEKELIFKSPTDYLFYFLNSLNRAYDLEQKRRGGYTPTDEEKKTDTIQGYTNPQENVLARYSNDVIQSKLREMDELIALRQDCVFELLS